jgi:hypothetical protein
MSAGWLKLVKNPAMNRSQRTRPTQFYLCKMHRHQIRQSMSRFAEVPNSEQFAGRNVIFEKKNYCAKIEKLKNYYTDKM